MCLLTETRALSAQGEKRALVGNLTMPCSGLVARAFRAFLRHRSSRVSSLCQAGVLARAARQPAGTGSTQIR